MQQIPDRSQLLRLPEVLKILPISKSTFYEGIDVGLFPKPVRLGKRTVAWRESDVRAAIDRLNAASQKDMNKTANGRLMLTKTSRRGHIS